MVELGEKASSAFFAQIGRDEDAFVSFLLLAPLLPTLGHYSSCHDKFSNLQHSGPVDEPVSALALSY